MQNAQSLIDLDFTTPASSNLPPALIPQSSSLLDANKTQNETTGTTPTLTTPFVFFDTNKTTTPNTSKPEINILFSDFILPVDQANSPTKTTTPTIVTTSPTTPTTKNAPIGNPFSETESVGTIVNNTINDNTNFNSPIGNTLQTSPERGSQPNATATKTEPKPSELSNKERLAAKKILLALRKSTSRNKFESLSFQHKNRQLVMNEILQTEKSYVRFLADLVNVQNQKKNFQGSKNG